MIVPAKTWHDIESSFQDEPEMLSLIRHIRTLQPADRLNGIVSLDKLIISIYDPLDTEKEALHVKFDRHAERWDFTYYAVPFKDPEFVRSYERSAGIDKFDSFIKMINW